MGLNPVSASKDVIRNLQHINADIIICFKPDLRSADDEASRGLDVKDGLLVDVLRRNDDIDDLPHDVSAQLLERDVIGVLDGHDYCVHAHRNARTVVETMLTGHLCVAKHTKDIIQVD